MNKYFLSRGHQAFFGHNDPLTFHDMNKILGPYIRGKGRIFERSYDKHPYFDKAKVIEKREELLSDYIEYIDPTRIVNNVLTDRPLLYTLKIKDLKNSIGKHGVLMPILVHTIDEYIKSHKNKFFKRDGKYYYMVKEGRHRALVTELIGHKDLIPAFVLIQNNRIKK